jgi:phage/plasmid-associated DNA primase
MSTTTSNTLNNLTSLTDVQLNDLVNRASSELSKRHLKSEMFQVNNGAIDLVTGEFHDTHTQEPILKADYKGLKSDTGIIDKFMSDLMLGDNAKIRSLQLLFGVTLIPGVSFKNLYLCGPGSNGKTTFIHLFYLLAGKLYTNKSSNKRGKKRKLNNEEDNDIFIEVTTRPNNINSDETLVINFPATFVDKKKYDSKNPSHRLIDTNILDKLSENLDQFLTWLVVGAVKFHKKDFNEAVIIHHLEK